MTTLPFIAGLETASTVDDAAAAEELVFGLAGAVRSALTDTPRRAREPGRRDVQRITDTVRRIETEAPRALSLSELAQDVAMSPYHFLRTFRRIVGMTPHQFLLRTRLHQAAAHLRRSPTPVSEVALDAGFNDLSTFNRHFRRVMGGPPSAYRAGATQARLPGVSRR